MKRGLIFIFIGPRHVLNLIFYSAPSITKFPFYSSTIILRENVTLEISFLDPLYLILSIYCDDNAKRKIDKDHVFQWQYYEGANCHISIGCKISQGKD